MVRELAKQFEKPDPLVKWALTVIGTMVGIIGTMGLIMLSDIKQSIDQNRTANADTRQLVQTMREGFAVQQEILTTNARVDADQEDRIRILERWQTAVNQQGGLNQ